MEKFLVKAGFVLALAGLLGGFAALRGGRQTVCALRDMAALTQDDFAAAAADCTDHPQKLVCLTFDDGPSATTESILDTLKQEGVPATFFVIAAENNQKYLPLIGRETEEGHQIALHTATHEYSKIYQSPQTYWLDIKALRKAVCRYTDLRQVNWLRFPGGSTNTVSRKYGGSGIMEQLKRQAGEKGYRYIDWNVCAEDAAGGHPTAEEILRNIQRDTGEKTVCVVLMHDTAATKTTAEALPDIIRWYRQQGFTFCTVEEMAGLTGKGLSKMGE